jgi:hypothetical protein
MTRRALENAAAYTGTEGERASRCTGLEETGVHLFTVADNYALADHYKRDILGKMSDRRSLINHSDNHGTQQEVISERAYDTVNFYERYVRPVLAEFFGVTLFVCIGCLSVQMSGVYAGTTFSGLGIACGHGLTIALLVVALGEVRYGHWVTAPVALC